MSNYIIDRYFAGLHYLIRFINKFLFMNLSFIFHLTP